MRIFCGYCGQTWEAYPRDDLTGKKANQCPHCGAKIAPGTWENVVSCLIRARNVNEKLMSDHVNDHNTLFAVSYVADHLFDSISEK